MKRTGITRTERPTRAFRCTICGGLFSRRYDWKPSNPEGIPRCTPCNRIARKVLLQVADRTPVPVIDNAGPRNANYRHGRRVGKHPTKPAVRRAVTERDGAWCLLCGTPGPGLHLHRVRYGSEGGEYEDTNCVLLCGPDHALVHSSKRTWKPLLLEHLAGDNPAALTELRRRLEVR